LLRQSLPFAVLLSDVAASECFTVYVCPIFVFKVTELHPD
jgi:hypothetical protein